MCVQIRLGLCLCREVNERYIQEMARVSFRLLEVFALGLGLKPKALHPMFEPSHTSFLRLNYYVSGLCLLCWILECCSLWFACLAGKQCTASCVQHLATARACVCCHLLVRTLHECVLMCCHACTMLVFLPPLLHSPLHAAHCAACIQ